MHLAAVGDRHGTHNGVSCAAATAACRQVGWIPVAVTLYPWSEPSPPCRPFFITSHAARYIVWSRIDQKTCFKAIGTAGYEAIVVQLKREGDALVTDTAALAAVLAQHPAESILCVVTTTSCFAPRVPDESADARSGERRRGGGGVEWIMWKHYNNFSSYVYFSTSVSVEAVAQMCQQHSIPHVINNAYGVQASKITHRVNQAMRVGRVDAIVQSTDKVDDSGETERRERAQSAKREQVLTVLLPLFANRIFLCPSAAASLPVPVWSLYGTSRSCIPVG